MYCIVCVQRGVFILICTVSGYFLFTKELTTPFKTIIEVIVGYFIDKGRKKKEVSSSDVIQEKETCHTPPVKFSGVISNQALLPDNKTIHLTASTEESQPQALKFGTEYERLLQDEELTDSHSKITVDRQKVHIDRSHYSHTSPDRSRDTTAMAVSTGSNHTTSLASQHSSRHKQMKVSSIAQPVHVGGSSKNRRTKPLRISHKQKEKTEEEKERTKENLTTQQSPIKMTSKSVTVTDQIDECTNTATNIICSSTSKEVKV